MVLLGCGGGATRSTWGGWDEGRDGGFGPTSPPPQLLLPPTMCNEEILEGTKFHPLGVRLGVDSFLGQHHLEVAGDQVKANKTLAFA